VNEPFLIRDSYPVPATNRRRKPGQEASQFKTDAETGRMVIAEDDSDDEDQGATDVAGTAFRSNLESVDGHTRGVNGRVKFNKDTKKRRAAELEDGDVEMADAPSVSTKPSSAKRKTSVKLGQEFKAKVRR